MRPYRFLSILYAKSATVCFLATTSATNGSGPVRPSGSSNLVGGPAALLALIGLFTCFSSAKATQPPGFNPFGKSPTVRDDAIPGYIELSNGTLITGHLHITRDGRLKLYDDKAKRQREVPWDRIVEIACDVERQWMEKEWRFVENANDRKVFTGRTYPAQILVHTLTLSDGRKIRGALSGIVYVQNAGKPTQRFLLNKRQKGKIGDKLNSLVYVRRIRLGDEALKEGNRRVSEWKDEELRKEKARRPDRSRHRQQSGLHTLPRSTAACRSPNTLNS